MEGNFKQSSRSSDKKKQPFHALNDSILDKLLLSKRQLSLCIKGSFINYVDGILAFFYTPSNAWTVIYHERGQKQTFFDPLPSHFVHIVIEWPIIQITPHFALNI